MANNNRQYNVKTYSKSGRTMNRIELLIFGAITIYIIVLVFLYFGSEPIKGYEVQLGSLSVSKMYTGIAIRKEETFTTSSTGYINYYIREGERVSTRDSVYSIDESGKMATLLNSGELGENKYSDEELDDFRTALIQYDREFSDRFFDSIYDFKYDLEGDVIKLVNLNMYENMESLNKSNAGSMVSLYNTGKTGYVVYSTDGYEDLVPEQITSDIFDQAAYEKKRINNNDLVEANSVVGKIITDENWSLVIPVDKDRAAELEEAEYIFIKFVKTQESSWAKVVIHHLESGDYAELVLNNSCVSFCKDRFVDIELSIDNKQGLKVPNSSIVEKDFFVIPAEYMTKGGPSGNLGVLKESFDENGEVIYKFTETTIYSSTEDEYYVDDMNLSIGDYIKKDNSNDKIAVSKTEKLIGVYNMNKGFADFKQITILAQNDEYAIVNSNTNYGLTVYDRIVLDAESVRNEEFVYK